MKAFAATVATLLFGILASGQTPDSQLPQGFPYGVGFLQLWDWLFWGEGRGAPPRGARDQLCEGGCTPLPLPREQPTHFPCNALRPRACLAELAVRL